MPREDKDRRRFRILAAGVVIAIVLGGLAVLTTFHNVRGLKHASGVEATHVTTAAGLKSHIGKPVRLVGRVSNRKAPGIVLEDAFVLIPDQPFWNYEAFGEREFVCTGILDFIESDPRWDAGVPIAGVAPPYFILRDVIAELIDQRSSDPGR